MVVMEMLTLRKGESVWTYYRPFAEMDPSEARIMMKTKTWEQWKNEILLVWEICGKI